jgi:hypothetical protein
MTILEMNVTTDIITEAHSKATEMGVLHKSITGGAGNLAGFVGEGLVAQYFLNREVEVRHYEHLRVRHAGNGSRVDVKTKRTSVKPRPDYDCSISDGKRQACDIYVFTRVKNDYSVGWLLGYMPSDEYFEVANFMEKGTIDPSNGWKVSRDCWNLPIEELRNIDELFKGFGGGH